jgi:starch-binding outer membrane protein, SusD/RagB family
MKNFKFLIVLVIIFAFSACNNYLEEQVYSSAQTSNFYENEQQGISALNGAYAALRDSYFTYPNDYTFTSMLECAAGTTTFNDGYDNLNYPQTELPIIARMWDRMWECINRSSTLISSLKVENIKEDSAKRIIGEAKFIRALCYFNLVRMWGKIPLNNDGVKSIKDAYLAKVDESKVYLQIIEDLKVAAQDLPTWSQYSALGTAGSGNLLVDYQGYEPGRATKGAAQALLAKVYLTIASSMESNSNQFENAFDKSQMYINARDMCSAVCNGGQGYGLIANYFDVFTDANEHGKEDVFSINYVEASDLKLGNSLASITGLKGAGILTSEIMRLKAVPAFLAEFSTTDKRRSATFCLEYYNNKNVKLIYPSTLKTLTFKKYWSDYQLAPDNLPMTATTYKYKTSVADKGRFGDDIPVIRYSDVLLMYAEALFATGDLANAQQRLADVRERAGLGRIIPAGNFMDLLIAERRKELCYENQLWFDYQRFNIVAKYRPNLADVKYKYFPIPTNDLMMNAGLLPQNQGW